VSISHLKDVLESELPVARVSSVSNDAQFLFQLDIVDSKLNVGVSDDLTLNLEKSIVVFEKLFPATRFVLIWESIAPHLIAFFGVELSADPRIKI
jgi:hypothetical protein